MLISGGFSSLLPLISGFAFTFLSVTFLSLSHIRLLIPPLLTAWEILLGAKEEKEDLGKE